MTVYLAKPPPGVQSDWSRAGWAPTIEHTCIALLVLNTLFVSSRLYTRSFVLRSFGIDDAFCICAYAMTTAEMILAFFALDNGFGRHAYDIPKSKAPGLYYSYFVLGLLPGPAYFFIKMTFFLTYLRIFSPVKYLRILIWVGMVITTAFYLGDFLYDLFQCHPIAKAWNPTLKGYCATESVPGGPTGIFNVISDLYILVIPMRMVWTLNVNWKRRIELAFVFSLGIFTFAMSVTRLANTVVSSHDSDHTYAVGPIYIWSNLEWSVGLWVASMIVFPAFWARVIHKPIVEYWNRISSAYQSMRSARSERLASRDGDVEQEKGAHKVVSTTQETGSS